jgi:hypothetical protein
VIRLYDEAGKVIETHEQAGEFKERYAREAKSRHTVKAWQLIAELGLVQLVDGIGDYSGRFAGIGVLPVARQSSKRPRGKETRPPTLFVEARPLPKTIGLCKQCE